MRHTFISDGTVKLNKQRKINTCTAEPPLQNGHLVDRVKPWYRVGHLWGDRAVTWQLSFAEYQFSMHIAAYLYLHLLSQMIFIDHLQLTSSTPCWMTIDERTVISFIKLLLSSNMAQGVCPLNLPGMAANHLYSFHANFNVKSLCSAN